METILIGFVVGTVVFFACRSMWRTWTGADRSGCAGCAGCGCGVDAACASEPGQDASQMDPARAGKEAAHG